MLKDTIQVTKDCASKFRLFIAHQVRCKNQNEAIYMIKQGMLDMLLHSNGKNVHAIMIIDFKNESRAAFSKRDQFGTLWEAWCLIAWCPSYIL